MGAVNDMYKKYREWQKRRKRAKKAAANLKKRIEFYSQFLASGDLCFDVGANIGNRTEAFLGIGAKVIAVEPQSSCLTTLHEKFDGNENVVILEKGLDKEIGESEIFLSEATTISSMSQDWIKTVQDIGAFPGHTWEKKEIVKTTTLDAVIGEYGTPKFCKIDVEGFEFQVLSGLSQPIPFVSLEFFREGIETTSNCIEHLLSLGSCEFNYSLGESMELNLDEWVNHEQLIGYLKALPIGSHIGGDIYVKMN